jgi:hypothetical protein
MIVREVKKDPFTTCKQIATNIGRPDLSSQTITRRLVPVGGFKCHLAAKKPFLSERNRVKRLQWARDHLHWTPQQWRSVLWSDESKFVIRYRASRKVWRLNGERLNPKNTNLNSLGVEVQWKTLMHTIKLGILTGTESRVNLSLHMRVHFEPTKLALCREFLQSSSSRE